MKKHDPRIRFCNFCGAICDQEREKCSCGMYPWGGHNAIKLLTTEQRKQLNISDEAYNNMFCDRFHFCLNCGYSIDDLDGNLDELECFMCGKNPCGFGKEYREEITIAFCEHCGRPAIDRDCRCVCGGLTYHGDNISSELFDLDGNENGPSLYEYVAVNYCKDCGKHLKEVSAYDYDEKINEITGEVRWRNNHPCNTFQSGEY